MQNIDSVWAYIIVEECIRNGITLFCISPGSRSTYLTGAVARHKKAKAKLFIDERSAAFFALGYAKATGKPAPLICTSGTAVANYFPAVVEAKMSGVPMMILSADRPPELRQTGANQTIQQTGIFGEYAKWQTDLPCPTEEIQPEMVLTTVDQAVFQSINELPGPVHLNCMFREPLQPEEVDLNAPALRHLSKWRESQTPFTSYCKPNDTNTSLNGDLNNLTDTLFSAKQPFITIGALRSPEEVMALYELCKQLNAPFYADISSGLRLSAFKNHVAHLDLLLNSEPFAKQFQPDVYVHIGGAMVSKRIQQHISKLDCNEKNLIKSHPYRFDQHHQFTQSFQWPLASFSKYFLSNLNPKLQTGTLDCTKASNAISETLEDYIQESELDERTLPMLVSKYIQPNQKLFLSNSMPVRDMDMFGLPAERMIHTGTNRGASGIDGIISSALGFMHGHQTSATLIIGDLSFMHDLNAIYQVQASEYPLILIVINNGGGGIFSYLPISSQKDIFETYFETPQVQDFEAIAGLAKIHYKQPKSNQEFAKVYQEAQNCSISTLIEIKTMRKENVAQHQALYAYLIKQLGKHGY